MGRAQNSQIASTDSFSVMGRRGPLPNQLFSDNEQTRDKEIKRILAKLDQDLRGVLKLVHALKEEHCEHPSVKALAQGVTDYLTNNKETASQWMDDLGCFYTRSLPTDYKRKLKEVSDKLALYLLLKETPDELEAMLEQQKIILEQEAGIEVAKTCKQNPNMLLVMMPNRYQDFITSLDAHNYKKEKLKEITLDEWKTVFRFSIAMADLKKMYDENPDISQTAASNLEIIIGTAIGALLVQKGELDDSWMQQRPAMTSLEEVE